MKSINRLRRPVAVCVMAALLLLLCLQAGPLPASQGSGKEKAAARGKWAGNGPDFIEQPGKGGSAAGKHRKFPWWLAVAGATIVVGAAVYFLVAKKAADEPVGPIIGDGTRVVVAEEFTGTWCVYCPGAAMGLEQLKNENPTKLAVIAYHDGDSFAVAGVSSARKSYYGVSGIPDVFFDGVERHTGGNSSQSIYSIYKPMFDRRAVVPAPVQFKLVDQGRNTIRVEVTNTSSQALAGTFHFLIVEDQIPFTWQNQIVLRFVCRSMLPSAAGEAISLDAGQMKALTRTYTIAPGWMRGNCHMVAFVQGSDKGIYQGIEADVPGS